jgi:acetylornithine deacetylase/succinyl-diaminopimelate desuccinylase-like protein
MTEGQGAMRAAGTREGAAARALACFDSGGFRDRLAALIAVPSTSQDPAHAASLRRYPDAHLRPWLEQLGFAVALHDNPVPGHGPILLAERLEDARSPTVLTYGHGDTVRGMDAQWRPGLSPWVLSEAADRWYGRGTADNKGQHALNLAALEAVIAERGGRLGCNIRLLLEMAEERGSPGLRAFVAGHAQALRADVLIASDGPRVAPEVPTIATGTRGSWHCDLAVTLRPGGVHSGHWGGMIPDPAVILAHALAAVCDRRGRILVPGWLPPGGLPDSVRAALAGCPVGAATDPARGDAAAIDAARGDLAAIDSARIDPSRGDLAAVDPNWGEPVLTAAEKLYGWTSFIVLAMTSGQPEAPVNAVAPSARAHCQLRYTVDVDPALFAPALRRHLDAHGFAEVRIEAEGVRMAASRTDPAHPWVRWAAASLQRSLGQRVQVIPNAAGGLPGDIFVEHLGVPLVWIPHSYTGCGQHGPDEHLLRAPAREAIAGMAGLWWDLGESGTPG